MSKTWVIAILAIIVVCCVVMIALCVKDVNEIDRDMEAGLDKALDTFQTEIVALACGFLLIMAIVMIGLAL